ncbi:acyltransferase [Solitalea sp. MAHUQ-68]|uniref:Acyltransferase n=1 Tax=Solitalea agri TaxID=2953739 RepID=A0A9X2F2D9_9SPHI|nr:acyltransferase [Solitalea agri]MCO4292920.1 acyltransferase [Solitalea agri]
MKEQHRLHGLDYLRGLAALGIMLYHVDFWINGKSGIDGFLPKVGIYGVSIFYILSGLTLYYVYIDKLSLTLNQLKNFFLKRFFRIFPLLWLSIILTALLNKKLPAADVLIYNLTGLFGIVKREYYLAAGAWSIGNELVFYLFFPVFILLIKKSKPLFFIFSALLLAIYSYFAFSGLSPNLTLEEQWAIYINPLNQVFLFLSGFLIGYFFKFLNIQSNFNLLILALAVVVFAFFPVYGDAGKIVMGYNRLLFSLLCWLICVCFYKLSINIPRWIDKPLSLLGEASYSLYLLHPIIWFLVGGAINVFSKHVFVIPDFIKGSSVILASLLVSYFSYLKFEKYFMKKGNEVISKLNTKFVKA